MTPELTSSLISPELAAAISAQVGREFGASLQYVSIAAYFDSESLPELAAFFYRQADEEKMHAMKFVHYVVEAGGHLAIPTIPAPTSEFASAEEAVRAAVHWEMEVTRNINDLVDQAIRERDHLAQGFLQWFVTEQLEEVSTMTTLHAIVRRAGDNLLFVEDYLARQPLPAAGAGA
jgi:bacterioferritin B